MADFEYRSDWFAAAIVKHDAVSEASPLENHHVQVTRIGNPPITVAPITTDRLRLSLVQRILAKEVPTVILLIPKGAHYMWDAREYAEVRGSTIHTMKELFTALKDEDPRPFVDKNVAYARQRLAQHSQVDKVRMICESSMVLVREDLHDVTIAIEYEYEFTEEGLVRALERHYPIQAVLNANPNGKPTRAALIHAREAKVGLFGLGELMGALNCDGEKFLNYRPPERPHSRPT